MLAEKIVKALLMTNEQCYKELKKQGFSIDEKSWIDLMKCFPEKCHDIHQKMLIKYLCDNEIRETARKSTMKPSQKKKIKAIEKFLDKTKKNHNTKDRPVFHHYKEEEGKIIYTNCHMLGVINKAEAQGINTAYNIDNYDLGVFPNYKQVIPELAADHQTATIKYGDVLATFKQAKAEKQDYDAHIVIFNDGTIGAYSAECLLHCFEVLGQDEITLQRNDKTTKWECRGKQQAQNIQTVIVTAENTSSFLVVSAIRMSQEVYDSYKKTT